jgi:hypothetical protein
MRVILMLWALPLAFFWGWFALSANDISFGTIFFSRELHDAVFEIYGRTLGIPAQDLPPMIAWACIVDTGIILAIAAFRWRARWFPRVREEIGRLREALFPATRMAVTEAAPADRALPAE